MYAFISYQCLVHASVRHVNHAVYLGVVVLIVVTDDKSHKNQLSLFSSLPSVTNVANALKSGPHLGNTIYNSPYTAYAHKMYIKLSLHY